MRRHNMNMRLRNLIANKIALLIAAVLLLIASPGFGQDAVPVEMLKRTICIRIGSQQGTGFYMDYQGKLYIITARHLVTGLTQDKATIQVRKSGEWVNIQTQKTLFPSSDDVDIAIFETEEKLSEPCSITAVTGGVTFGQQVWFLGYPWGIGSKFHNDIELPFIKRGTMSAIDGTNPNAIVLYIDGFNNPGFSGGPIVYWDFSEHRYKIFGVVKGYKTDTAKVRVKGEYLDTQLLVNSGILIGYSIKHALQAIESNSK